MSRRELAKRRNLLASRLPMIARYVRPRFGSQIFVDAEGDPYVQFLSKEHYASLHVNHDGRSHVFVDRRGGDGFVSYTGLGPRAIGRTLARTFGHGGDGVKEA